MVESSDIASRIWLIAGPTASGKSAYALDLAERIDGEIVNADSMQIDLAGEADAEHLAGFDHGRAIDDLGVQQQAVHVEDHALDAAGKTHAWNSSAL